MKINFFVEAQVEKEAIRLVQDGLYSMEEIIVSKEEQKVAPYWKMENVYIVEMTVELSQNTLQFFLESFSDDWLEIGNPVEELLASKTNQGCKYMKEGFVLINIFL
ncbi:MAG: hypothetical protein IJA10_09025 [Lachnospiraceae bacterium]|nr:hypothetical protein [Lachnospiraceae bacterium]